LHLCTRPLGSARDNRCSDVTNVDFQRIDLQVSRYPAALRHDCCTPENVNSALQVSWSFLLPVVRNP
jgi:hypothetical protein